MNFADGRRPQVGLQPPAIFPSSGMYSPPVQVKITQTSPRRPGDVLFYITQTSDSAAQIASEKGFATLTGRRKYVEPFTLRTPGRVKITAFVWNPEEGDGPAATALYMLDGQAPPAVSQTQAGTLVPMPTESTQAAIQADALIRSAPAMSVQAQTRSLVTAREELPYFYDIRLLQYTQLPAVVQPFVPFSLVLHLVDATGAPVALQLDTPEMHLAITGDALRSTSPVAGEEKIPLAVVALDASAFVKRRDRGTGNRDGGTVLKWRTVHNLLVDAAGTSVRRGDPTSMGWDAFASSEPLVGRDEAFTGVSFRVVNLCRAIVGLHGAEVDGGKDSSWRQLPFSIHLSADVHDPATAPAFRIYQDGLQSETVGTRDFAVGDCFAIRVQNGGQVVYYHNDSVVARSEFPVQRGTPLSVMIRVGAQQHEGAAIADFEFLRHETPIPIEVSGLVWKPPVALTAEEEGQLQGHSVVLRTWIVGSEFVPATARIPLVIRPVPKWALAAVSLASMFALGAAGCQGSHVSARLLKAHQKDPQLKRLSTGSNEQTATDEAQNASPKPRVTAPGSPSRNLFQTPSHSAVHVRDVEEFYPAEGPVTRASMSADHTIQRPAFPLQIASERTFPASSEKGRQAVYPLRVEESSLFPREMDVHGSSQSVLHSFREQRGRERYALSDLIGPRL